MDSTQIGTQAVTGFMNESVCSLSPEPEASEAGLRKHLKGAVRFISPLFVNFKLSNSRQQKYGMIIRKTELRKHRLGEFMNELVKGFHKTMMLCIRILFNWVCANP